MSRLIGKMKSKSAAENVRKLGSTKWNPAHADVIAYRVQLLEAQEYTCAYCRRPIYRDELGFREIDHVLPKSQAPSEPKDFDAVKASSNLVSNRRHTRGYKEFTYVPENLVIACKRCNSHKGSYDGLANRATKPAIYPSVGKHFEWVNPHCNSPEAHVEILDGYVYRAKNGSVKGAAVIHECGLDTIEQLKARTLDALVFTNKDLIDAMLEAVISRENFDSDHIAGVLHLSHPTVPLQFLKDAVRLARAERAVRGGAGLNAAIQVVIKQLDELRAQQDVNAQQPEPAAV
ncbi:hypothetical protein A6V36_20490 [Paraburkholderia ginsengiterrae]|uniref:HNH nuclease domain-containing protein n=1 Tax=Paraburkholderia ginsengiterrae TaxID=1462993 RepID=A0A1A9NE41_9BURK|nr:HNH endonuclease signature motif containing protein [Paraburkholderia ginsengiterrae]OAJ62753.1 hypothetical protein A6V36_20490 [Paraburkholderia ginsengiterrae]OAJ64414.1 hypothetical protein A6V37_19515 [Paraburkholderia ginsengiterrae]